MACDRLWQEIRSDAEAMHSEDGAAADESMDLDAADLVDFQEIRVILSDSLQRSILQWPSLDESLAAHLASKLSSDSVPPERWRSLLLSCFVTGSSWSGESVRDAVRKDLMSIKVRPIICLSQSVSGQRQAMEMA
jgi:hypothetical protein